jgi:hypothetical protein
LQWPGPCSSPAWAGELQRGFSAGFITATGVWLVTLFLILRTYSATTGEWSEGFTAEALASRRLGWRVINDVPMSGFNIDHVAVTPAAVLAVETKYRGATAIGAVRRRQDLDAARRSARYVRLLLQSADFQVSAPVHGVLMLWGPGARADGGHYWDDDVLVIQGAAGDDWKDHFKRGPIGEDLARTIEAKFRAYQQKRDDYDSRSRPARGSRLDPGSRSKG